MIILNKLDNKEQVYSALLTDGEIRLYSSFFGRFFKKETEADKAAKAKKGAVEYASGKGYADKAVQENGMEHLLRRKQGLSYDQGAIDKMIQSNEARGRGISKSSAKQTTEKVSQGLGKKALKYGGGAAVLGGAAYGGYKYLQGRKQKSYTRYDDSDILKQTKDSDILAEQKRSNTGSYLGALGTAATGAAAGATIGGTVGAFRGLRRGGKGFIGGMKSGGAKGALALGAISGVAALASGRKQREDNQFYNKRLDYAQKQARRREQRDWKNNMTNRVSYTY